MKLVARALVVILLVTPFATGTQALGISWQTGSSENDAIAVTPESNQDGYKVLETGKLNGQLLIAEGHPRDAKGTTKYAYFLREQTGRILFVEFTGSKPSLEYSGKDVEITGDLVQDADGEHIRASQYTTSQTAATTGIKAVTGPQSYVTLLSKFTDVGSEPQASTWFSGMIYGTTGSTVNTYFQEDSFGLISYTGATFGWTFLSTYAYISGALVNHGASDRSHFLTGGAFGSCGPGDNGACLSDILYHAVGTFDASVNFAAYGQGINIELNDNIGCCAWGTIGPWTVSTADGTFNRGVIWMPPWAQTPGIHGHENGHAIGWIHSGFNYDDVWSQMSGGTHYNCPYDPRYTINTCPSHSHGQEKEQQGWILASNILTVSSGSSVTVNLQRLETSAVATQLVKLTIPCSMVSWATGGPCLLYVETRTWSGFDGGYPSGSGTGGLPGQGVIITKYATSTSGGDWKLRPVLRGGTMNTAYFRVGDTYVEGDIKVEVLSAGSNYFQVRVTNGPLANAITFNTNPTGQGSITACGGTFANGQSSTGCGGSFSATANLPLPSSDWQFHHWEVSGGVSCNNLSSNPTSCTVSGSGSLKAVYAAKVTFVTTSNTGPVGSISWGSCANAGHPNGDTIFDYSLPPEFSNSITACANVPSGYTFQSWSCGGGLACSGSSTSTMVTFTGPGSITATFQQITGGDLASTSLSVTFPASAVAVGSFFVVGGTLKGNWHELSGVVSGKQVVVRGSWGASSSAMTRNDGTFTVTLQAPGAIGTYSLTVQFAGDVFFQSSSASGNLIVQTVGLPTMLFVDAEARGSLVMISGLLQASTGAGVPGRVITLRVYSFGVLLATFTATTDSSGYFLVSLSDAPNASSVVASFAGDLQYQPSSATASVAHSSPPLPNPNGPSKIMSILLNAADVASTSLSVNFPAGSVAVGAIFTIQGILRGSWHELTGVVSSKQVCATRSWSGTPICATTASDGTFSMSMQAPGAIGTYALTVQFVGDAFFLGSSASGSLVVQTLGLPTMLFVDAESRGSFVTISGLLQASDGSGVPGRVITLKVYSFGTLLATFTATTNSSGYFLVNVYAPNASSVTATFAGDSSYQASSATAPVLRS